MYKLKNSYIDKMIENQLSSKEIDFILYIAKFQDTTGTIHSVYYKNICEKVDISTQKFYDILNSLQSKGLISYEKKYRTDINVTLIGNGWDANEEIKSYLNVASKDFTNKSFRELKAGAKLIYLYMQRFTTKGQHMFVAEFYDKYRDLFHVTKKSIQIYIHELKERFLLHVSKKRNKSYHYETNIKNSKKIDIEKDQIPNENSLYEENVELLIKNNFVVLTEDDLGDLHQVTSLIMQARSKGKSSIVDKLMESICDSIDKQKQEGKENLHLKASLVNQFFTEKIGVYNN